MKTLFFLQGNPGNGGGTAACDTPNPPWWCDEFDPEPVASIDDWSYWIFGIIVLIGVAYMAYAVFIAYREIYFKPKKQSKWLRERYPEEEQK